MKNVQAARVGRQMRIVMLVVSCAAVAGCADMEVPPSDSEAAQAPAVSLLHLAAVRQSADAKIALTNDERDQAMSILRVRGVDVSSARYVGEDWLMVDDLIYDARGLLHEANGNVDKGYFWQSAVLVSGYKQIHVAGDPNLPPNATWTWAFVTGGADWNAKTHVGFTTAAPGSGATVLWVQAGSFAAAFGPGYDCLAAATLVPSGGQPGIIAINTSFHCTNTSVPAACRVATLDSLSWDEKVHVATHEMGHSLGFAHPLDPSPVGVHIVNTATAINTNTPTYPSMMWGGTGSCYTGTGNVTLGLSSDDVASSNAAYH